MRAQKLQKLTIRDEHLTAPIWIIDQFYDRPDEVMKHIESLKFSKDHNPQYPGLCHMTQAGMPLALQIIREVFALEKTQVRGLSFFARMDPLQREQSAKRPPHVDPFAFAAVVYLSDQNLGGTGFFQHHKTKVWRTDQWDAVMPSFDEQAKERGFASGIELYRHLKQDGLQAWKTLASVPAAFNRMALYPASLFHSALPASTGGDRLTQNFFFSLGG